jgi:hypothetical protein
MQPRKGIYDAELAEMDLFNAYMQIVLDVTEKYAYPRVHVPDDLEGRDRILWRLENPLWWRQLAWDCYRKTKRMFRWTKRPPIMYVGYPDWRVAQGLDTVSDFGQGVPSTRPGLNFEF